MAAASVAPWDSRRVRAGWLRKGNGAQNVTDLPRPIGITHVLVVQFRVAFNLPRHDPTIPWLWWSKSAAAARACERRSARAARSTRASPCHRAATPAGRSSSSAIRWASPSLHLVPEHVYIVLNRQ